jgi:hypothetical protein
MGKYEPLQQFLSRLDGDHWKPTFLELERMLGFDLPAAAKKRPTWWTEASDRRNGHAAAWAGAGWTVKGVDMDKETVNFVRAGQAEAAAPAAAQPAPPLRERIAAQRDRLSAGRAAAARQLRERPLSVAGASAGLAFAVGVGLGYLLVRAAREPASEAFEAAQARARQALALLGERAHEVEAVLGERIRRLRS